MWRSIVVEVDRDSVAMGDDMQSHAHRITVASGTRLSTLLDRASPEIRGDGWSWVAVADGRVVAVWSTNHGAQLLVPDSRVTQKLGPHSVHFRYFASMAPAWLHSRLSDGAPPDRRALELEYQPLARAASQQEERRREREVPGRLLSAECISALQSLGAQIDLHNDRTVWFDVSGTRWTTRRSDTMTMVFRGEGGPTASIRPLAFAECWLIAAVGAEARLARGLPRFPDAEPIQAPELTPMSSWPPGTQRWTTTGDLIAQLSGDDAVDCYSFAFGRSIAQITDLLGDSASSD